MRREKRKNGAMTAQIPQNASAIGNSMHKKTDESQKVKIKIPKIEKYIAKTP